jgi:hypothetical protein
MFLLLSLSSVALHAHAEPIALAVNAGTGDSKNLYAAEDTYRVFAKLLGKALNADVVAKPLLASLVGSSIAGNRYPLLLVHTNDAAEAIKSKRYVAIAFSQNIADSRVLFFARKGSTATKLADIEGRCVVATDPFAAATGVAILKKEKIFGKVSSYKYIRESDALDFYLRTKSCEIAILRSDAIARKLSAAGNKLIHKSPEYPVYVLLADQKFGDAVFGKMRKMVIEEFQPDPESQFMKETGIVTFLTDQNSAVDLIELY